MKSASDFLLGIACGLVFGCLAMIVIASIGARPDAPERVVWMPTARPRYLLKEPCPPAPPPSRVDGPPADLAARSDHRATVALGFTRTP